MLLGADNIQKAYIKTQVHVFQASYKTFKLTTTHDYVTDHIRLLNHEPIFTPMPY